MSERKADVPCRIVWSNRHRVGRLGKRAFRLAVFLTFAAAIAALLPISSWFPAIFAFVAGGVEVFVIIAERRKEHLVEAFKKTKPQVQALLDTTADGTYVVRIQPLNDVPFFCDWRVYTKNGVRASSEIGLERPKITPHPDKPVHLYAVGIDLDKVQNRYIELRFDFESIYAGDYPNLTLSGRIVSKHLALTHNELDKLGSSEDE